jgi:hypothetical protein
MMDSVQNDQLAYCNIFVFYRMWSFPPSGSENLLFSPAVPLTLFYRRALKCQFPASKQALHLLQMCHGMQQTSYLGMLAVSL